MLVAPNLDGVASRVASGVPTPLTVHAHIVLSHFQVPSQGSASSDLPVVLETHNPLY